MRKFLALDAIYESSRMIVGAVSANYVVSRGFPIYTVAQLKFVQTASSVLMELPTGILADRLGRRNSLLCSAALGAIAMFIFGAASNLISFFLAEILLSLSLCFWSGAYEAYSIDQLKIDGDSTAISQFFHSNSAWITGASLTAGLMGGLLAESGWTLPYFFGSALFMVCALALASIFPNDHPAATGHSKPGLMTSLFEIKNIVQTDANLRPILFMTVISQFAAAPLIYYWQPLLSERGMSATAHLGVVFVLIQATILATSTLLARSITLRKALGFRVALPLIGAFAALLLVSPIIPSTLGLLSCIVGLEILLTLGQTAVRSELNLRAPSHCRATILSAVSLLGKAASALALTGISVGKPQSAGLVFGVIGALAFFATVGMAGIRARKGFSYVPNTA